MVSDPSSDDHKPQTIQEMGDEFMRFLGMCITEWAQIEEVLFEVCLTILKTTKELTAIVYYRTPTLDSRLQLADELISTVFPPPNPGDHPSPERKAWKAIYDQFKCLLPERNLLAHGVAGPTITDISGEWLHDVRYEAYPHPHERMRGKSTKEPMALADLKKHISGAAHLWCDLRNFQRALPARIAKL